MTKIEAIYTLHRFQRRTLYNASLKCKFNQNELKTLMKIKLESLQSLYDVYIFIILSTKTF